MWLYIPNGKRTSASTPVAADSISDSDSRIQMLSRCCTWKETWKPPRSWLTILRRDSYMRHLYGAIPEPSIANRLLEKWISSLPDFRVSRGVTQESGKKQTTRGGSGHTSNELFARFDAEDSSWKTSQVSLGGVSNLYSQAWPRTGSMRNGQVSKRPMWEPPTDANGFSSWPTATTDSAVNRSKRYAQGGQPLSKAAGEWPTPSTQEYPHPDMVINEKGRREPKKGKTDHSLNLEDRTSIWATPRASEWKGAGPPGSASHEHMLKRHYLTAQTEDFHQHPMTEKPGEKSSDTDPTSPQQRQRLNTKFVEWLMGWPEDWVELHSLKS